jgi:hypothetical protein
MSTIDKQRIAAVRTMEALGYSFNGVEWLAPAGGAPSNPMEADAMHSLLVLRADKLVCANEGSEEELELELITDAVAAYEAKRWPDGKIPGGKG